MVQEKGAEPIRPEIRVHMETTNGGGETTVQEITERFEIKADVHQTGDT